jgi:hypothetical protein
MADAGRLQAWIRQQIDSGLPAFAGARVTGSVPVQVSLLNDLIAQALADAAAGDARPGGTSGLDVSTLVRMVRHVRVDAAPGVITLDFEVGVGG